MNPLLRLGTTIVIFALASYSFAVFAIHRKKILRRRILVFLTLGVALDITATIFMILGSSKGGFTAHGIIGYSSLLGMFIDAVLIWQMKIKQGSYSPIPDGIQKYSRYAYFWWVIAFITGGVLVALR
ncbi:MAG TPA: hypothetical protein VLQ91_18125 [Draconibacterium sp.]|nr:hypothetical protein [Draconibacterium sp.]